MKHCNYCDGDFSMVDYAKHLKSAGGDCPGNSFRERTIHNNDLKRLTEEKMLIERVTPKCPQCGAMMEFDPGDGCVHESEWYCKKGGCHYNDRAYGLTAMIVGITMLREGQSKDVVDAEIKKLFAEDSE